MQQVAVFTDPTNHPDYVREYVRVFHERWGIGAVLLYPSEVSPFLVAQANAVIGRRGVRARYTADLSEMPAIAAFLQHRFDVVASVPQAEYQVLPAARLARLFNIERVPYEVIARFRDKFSLKDFLRGVPDGPRVNLSAQVSDAGAVRDFVREHDLGRFVLKPNHGAGNSRIAFFDRDAPTAHVEGYFAQNPEVDVLLEEFIEGHEYCVNGQVDEYGTVRTYSLQRSVYMQANGRSNLGGCYRMLRRDSEEFQIAQDYATHVLTCAGLRASPFHMEVKIGPAGACLIEVAARLGGAGIPRDTALAHGGRVDLFAEAARCYAGLPGDATEPDWRTYDGARVWTVLGVAGRDERITSLRGVRQVEALPEFAYWVVPPQLGQTVHRTIDLSTSPWQVTLRGADEDVASAERKVRKLITWNERDAGPLRGMRARLAWARRRLPLVPALVSDRPRRLGTTRGHPRHAGQQGTRVPAR